MLIQEGTRFSHDSCGLAEGRVEELAPRRALLNDERSEDPDVDNKVLIKGSATPVIKS
jgi:hypothetical protein